MIVVLQFIKAEQSIKYEYLLKFFRYTFIACIIVYLSPLFADQMKYLFVEGVIFKEQFSLFQAAIALRHHRWRQ